MNSKYKLVPVEPTPEMEHGPVEFDEDAALSLAERTFSTEIDEQLASDVIQFASRLRALYTAPQPAYQQPAPDVEALVEALEAICEMQERNYGYGMETHIELAQLTDTARKALAAHRQQKGEA